jgi:DnaK suppressor protein
MGGAIMIDLNLAQNRLAAKKNELSDLSELSSESRDPVALDQQSVGRLSRMDAIQQQAMSQATEQKRKYDLIRIESTERRLRDGDYGYCEECGEEIPDGRLAIDPMAECCVNCAR